MITNPTPIKDYTAPNIPTLEESRKNHNFLAKLPLRWRRCATIATCAGLIGTVGLAGIAVQTPVEAKSKSKSVQSAAAYNLDINDALAVLKHIAGMEELSEQRLEKLMIKGNPAISDAIEILKYVAGMPSIYEPCKPSLTYRTTVLHKTDKGTSPETDEATTPPVTEPPKSSETDEVTTPPVTEPPTPPETDEITAPPVDADVSGLTFKMHVGGTGFASYVVYFTEQEALGIIKANLEQAGFNFGATPPNYTAVGQYGYGTDEFLPKIPLSLFDDKKNVAIANISWENNNQPFRYHGGSEFARDAKKEFEEKAQEDGKDIKFGVFYSQGKAVGYANSWGGADDDDKWKDFDYLSYLQNPTEEQKEKVRQAKLSALPTVEASLNKQIEDFIKLMQEDGIL